MSAGRQSTTHDPQRLRTIVQPLSGTAADLANVVETAARKEYVLIGEATRGTHEFYHTPAELTKRLVRDKGFAGVAIEGGGPDAYRNRRRHSAGSSAFQRGCGATPTSLNLSAGCVSSTTRERAARPLERTAMWETSEVPETFPSGV